MSASRISPAQRARIAETAGYKCGYCQTQELIIGMPLVIDHIIPKAKGGTSEDGNLWLACYRCNEFKSVQTFLADPETGKKTLLFNPRTQIWSDHFAWDKEGIRVRG
ncbi:MAG: HNH endonuclease [Chloroflexi bacterium]|nr:HNH endonuclease [Chloroflexota bacterium]